MAPLQPLRPARSLEAHRAPPARPPARPRALPRGVTRPWAAALLGACLPGLAACGPTETTYEVEDVRQVAQPPPPPPPGLTDAQRLRFLHDADPAEAGPAARRWEHETPEGWTPLPPAELRELGWTVPGTPGGECTFAVYQGRAGGLLANLNRWRRQLGLEETTAEALAALPKGRLLGQEALRVELAGTYGGMSGTRKDEGYALLGLMAELPMATAFLKLVGPAALVAEQTPRFLALADSLRMASATRPPGAGAAPAAGAGVPPPPTSEPPFAWTAPAGWKDQGPRTMRLATFVPEGAPGSEVYVSQFSGSVGGVRSNVDRWRGEMGLPPVTDAELEGLPRLRALDVEGVLVVAEGRFSGGMSGKAIPGARLLGLILPRARDAVFVKMVGPAEEVRREEQRFREFCGSLRE